MAVAPAAMSLIAMPTFVGLPVGLAGHPQEARQRPAP